MQLEHGDDYCTSWYAMKEALRRRFAPPFEPEKNILSSSGSSDLVASKFSSATPFEKNNSTNQPAIMGLPSDIPTATSIVGEDVPLNTSISDISSPLEQQAGVPEQISIDERVDLSLASGLHATDSSCDTQPDIKIDDNDVASNGLSMMAREVHSDGTTIDVRGQRSNIFHSECKVHDKVCKLIIDGGSFTNAISSDLVNALSLPTRRLPKPHYMRWMNESGTLKITHKTRVKFSIGNYMDTVDCDVVPMSACHLLLGRPWQFDLDATHGGRSNNYSFVHKGVHHVLKPMPVSAIKAEVFATSKVKKKVAAITPMPRTALFLERENGMAIPVSIHCDGNSKISTNTRKKDAIITSPIVDSGNICKDSEAIAGKLLKPSAIHFSSLADEKKEKDKKNIAAIMSCNNKVTKVVPIKHANAKNMPKSRTTLIQGGENDEPIAPQDGQGDMSSDNSNIAAGNSLISSDLQFGAILFDEKYGKNMEKFTSAGLSSNILFRGVNCHNKEEEKKKRKYIYIGAMQVDVDD